MKLLDKVYAYLPTWAQNTAVTAYGIYWHWLRFGPGYEQHLKDYLKRESFTDGDWQHWQQDRLKKLLLIASENIPYYRHTWNKREHDSARAGELTQLPFLEKEPLRTNPMDFIREDIFPYPRFVFHTSGSTGTPIASIWKITEIRNSIALREVRSARWAGVSFQMPRATFSGRMVEPDPNSGGPYYRFNAVEKQVYFSPFHLRPDTAKYYLNAIEKHQIQWLTGYAVSWYLLAKFILDLGLVFSGKIKAIITTSEKVEPEMRAIMEMAFQCRVYEEYSTVENALFASECEHGRLHVSPDVAVVEIVRPDGTACQPGEIGEVVATSLSRTYQHFIRFRLGDLAAWDKDSCPCERVMPVIKEVIGRVEDIVVSPDGRQMVRFHGIFVDQPHIREGQIIQESLDRIRVKVVPADGFGDLDVLEIVQRVQSRLGKQVHTIVETVETIPRTTAGKFKAVVSHLDKP